MVVCMESGLDLAFWWILARRREEVGERGANMTDLLCGGVGESGEDRGDCVASGIRRWAVEIEPSANLSNEYEYKD